MKFLILIVVVAGLGAVVGAIYVGARLKEPTVVADPYQAGLHYDEHRHEGTSSTVTAGQPSQSRDSALDRDKRGQGFTAGQPSQPRDLSSAAPAEPSPPRAPASPAPAEPSQSRVPAPDRGETRSGVRRDEARPGIRRDERDQRSCDLQAGPCTQPLPGGGEVTLEVLPRPVRAMRDLEFILTFTPAHAAAGGDVALALGMPGMYMGETRAALAPAGAGVFRGKGVLVRCPSGRRDWSAEVLLRRSAPPGSDAGGAPLRVAFPLTVAE